MTPGIYYEIKSNWLSRLHQKWLSIKRNFSLDWISVLLFTFDSCFNSLFFNFYCSIFYLRILGKISKNVCSCTCKLLSFALHFHSINFYRKWIWIDFENGICFEHKGFDIFSSKSLSWLFAAVKLLSSLNLCFLCFDLYDNIAAVEPVPKRVRGHPLLPVCKKKNRLEISTYP